MARRIKNTNITERIINLLAKADAAAEIFLEFTYHPHRFIYKNLVDEVGAKESSIRSAFTRLEKKGLVKRKMNNHQQILFKLTDRGQLWWLKKKLRSEQIGKLQDRFVVVVFDIPEASRGVRNALRRNLREFGFKSWQRSVWVTNKDVFDLATLYFNSTDLSKHVILFETSKSSQR